MIIQIKLQRKFTLYSQYNCGVISEDNLHRLSSKYITHDWGKRIPPKLGKKASLIIGDWGIKEPAKCGSPNISKALEIQGSDSPISEDTNCGHMTPQNSCHMKRMVVI